MGFEDFFFQKRPDISEEIFIDGSGNQFSGPGPPHGLGNGDILRMISFAGLLILIVGGITLLVGRLLRLDKKLLAACLISAMFMNAGNFGLSVVLFAFGENSLAYSSLFFVTSSVMINTLGVIIASLGSANLRQALVSFLKLPAVYSLALGFVFLETGWTLPTPVERVTEVLGNAAIPGMLVLLGMQLQIVRGKVLAPPLRWSMSCGWWSAR